MVLSGLTFSSWQAWLAGIYFIKHPHLKNYPGHPTGRCGHPYILYAFCICLANIYMWADFHMKVQPYSLTLSLTERILTNAVFAMGALFDIYFRLIMYWNNRTVGKLLATLEHKKENPLDEELRELWTFHRISLRFLMVFRYSALIVTGIWYAHWTGKDHKLEFILPRPWYFIVFGVLAGMSYVTPAVFSYDIIVETTFEMLGTFEDYCVTLEAYIYGDQTKNKYGQKLTNVSEEVGFIVTNKSGNPNENRKYIRDDDAMLGSACTSTFVNKFEKIRNTGEKFDKVVGPILIGVVVRSVISVIHSTYGIVNGKSDNFEEIIMTLFYGLELVIEAGQLLIILKLGSAVDERIVNWKTKLTKACLLMGLRKNCARENTLPGSSLDSEVTLKAVEMEDKNLQQCTSAEAQSLVKYAGEWNWKLSACGIFDVNNSLICGIVSTTMTYVVILFQLNLGDNSDSNNAAQTANKVMHPTNPCNLTT